MDPYIPKHGEQVSQKLASTSETHQNSELELKKTDTKWSLKVNEDVTLLLDSVRLHIRDSTKVQKPSKFYSSFLQKPDSKDDRREIALYNVLWASISGSKLEIQYAQSTSKTTVQATKLEFVISKNDEQVPSWIEELLSRAYKTSQRQKRAKILVNPKAGKGSALKLYANDVLPIFQAAGLAIDMTITKHSGEAVDLARDLDIESHDALVCCSGDGLPYEVFNGLAKRPDARKALHKIAIAHIPCGSGNGMSCNLNGTGSASLAALAVVKGFRTPFDLISVTSGTDRIVSFLSQGVGIVAEFDLATEHLRWMGGTFRFSYGFVTRTLMSKVFPCDISFKLGMEGKYEIQKFYQDELEKMAGECAEHDNEIGDKRRGTREGVEGGEGLPVLKYGTVNDAMPEEWVTVPYENLSSMWSGNMGWMATDVRFFPFALPSDGLIDLVCVQDLNNRIASLKLMTDSATGDHFKSDLIIYRKVEAFRLVPRKQPTGYFSVDGESVPFGPFQAEIHRGLGTVLSKTGYAFEETLT